MAKKWKNLQKGINYEFIDYYNRIAPCLYINDTIYIGNKGSTHATMVQELFYGMNFEGKYENIYFNDEQGARFGRTLIEDCEDYVFGHLMNEHEIVWDMYDGTIDNFNKLKRFCAEDNFYNHAICDREDKIYDIKLYNFR